jgi:hypothetical protein
MTPIFLYSSNMGLFHPARPASQAGLGGVIWLCKYHFCFYEAFCLRRCGCYRMIAFQQLTHVYVPFDEELS